MEGKLRGLRAATVPAVLATGVVLAFLAGRVPPGKMTFVTYPADEVAGVENVHDFQGRPLCQSCHHKADMSLTAEPILLCTGCHPEHRGSHPVRVRQVTPAEVGLPLEDGTVVCHTCHESHDLKRFPLGLRLPFNDLCLRCHQRH